MTFTVDAVTGALGAVGMLLHEFPEGIIMVALLKHRGYARRKAAWIAFLTAGITTPAGALASYPVVQHLGPGFLGPLLALSGGALVYLGQSICCPSR